MVAALQDALTNRQAADAADPTHSDPAWASDETTPWNTRAKRGVSHDDLMAFYEASIAKLAVKITTTETAVSASASIGMTKATI